MRVIPPLLVVVLEIPRGGWPIRGHVRFPDEPPQPFWGWAELRTLVHLALGRSESHVARLTKAETRVVSLVCEGLSNPEIARILVMSPRTVQGHLYRVFKKLGVQTRSELVAWSINGSNRRPSARDSNNIEPIDSREHGDERTTRH